MQTKLWPHQQEAIGTFMMLEKGILEMATGTGKTKTSLEIMKKLLAEGNVDLVIVIVYGNDLLNQWYGELLVNLPEAGVYRWYEAYRELSTYLLCGEEQSVLLLSRDAERIAECLDRLERQRGYEYSRAHTLLVFDEVHGMGARSFRKNLQGKIRRYRYRLGMSATPVREFDQEGNRFLEEEIGRVIYHFGLAEAIQKGILCEFEYLPLSYRLTIEERQKKKRLIAAYESRLNQGQDMNPEELYRDLARVNKTASDKLNQFQIYIQQNPKFLRQCIIFVETREYGLEVQKILMHHTFRFHTYYGEDDRENLKRFADGTLDCLVTCKKISEGIDMRSVQHIVLFSSDRGLLTTTQRIGRCLRKNPEDLHKRSGILDFVCDSGKMAEEDTTADAERKKWLEQLAKTRREANGNL